MAKTAAAQVASATGLEVRGVVFGYAEDQPVLHGLDAALAPGRLCALIGPNATGKTTLLRLIMGQLRPWQGSIHLNGRSVAGLSPARRAALVSYVPQRGLVSFAFTVEQIVAMGRYALTRDPAAVDAAIEQADLLRHRHRPYHELSAGQQQRVLLARAIAQAADHARGRARGGLMLLDEPVSMMDLWHIHQTMATLRRLAQAGMSILVVLHDLNLASRYADEVWLMHEGRMLAAGSWQQVLSPPILEPVYRVRLIGHPVEGSDRPFFAAHLPDVDMMN